MAWPVAVNAGSLAALPRQARSIFGRPRGISRRRVDNLITLTNGADNVGVYVPYFLLNRSDLLWILVSYGVFMGAWRFIGWWIGNHPAVLRGGDKWGHWIMPTVLIGLGIYLLVF